ncbi:MAG: hypothetical protein OXC84_05600 [Gammaproteobacteria bacterium]|nr:hypothetical protein [Gammaproteobacteria bacterium]
MADRLQIEVDGPVKTVTLTRPEKRNALDAAMLDALYETFTEVPAATDREGVSARLGKRAPKFTGS